MKRTKDAFLYMGLLLIIGLLLSAIVKGVEYIVGPVITVMILLVILFFLVRAQLR